MKERTYYCISFLAVALVAALLLQGCGGGGAGGEGGISTISGTVSDINRDVIIGADVWADRDETRHTQSLVSGAFKLSSIPSGWTTLRASATVSGETWVGSTAVEVLSNEPTMNANIVLSPITETTSIGGIVRDDENRRVSGARVLLTTRVLYPAGDTSAGDGAYSSIVAVTDSNGSYLLEDVPVGIAATVSASKVGFHNNEKEITTVSQGDVVNFDLVPAELDYVLLAPSFEAIESYTMPDSVTRSDVGAYKAVRVFASKRYRQALANRKNKNMVSTTTRATPLGSLIEIDLYWNSLGEDGNGDSDDSRNIAGYGIYRTTSPAIDMTSIDFVRDPYANFYGDTGTEITPDQTYYYAVTSVDVLFLDQFNQPDPNAESPLSNTLSVMPLNQLHAQFPGQGTSVPGNPTFTWTHLSGAEWYAVYVYDKFPTLPLDPSYDYGSDPIASIGVLPVWPTTSNPNGSTADAGDTSISYSGPALASGHTYYWVILAGDNNGAYAYSQLRHFTKG